MENFYAALDWEDRWNGVEQIAGLSQDGSKIQAVGWFGYVSLDLNDPKSVESCVQQTRAFADLLENTLKEYQSWDTTSSSSAAGQPDSSPRKLRPRIRGSKTSGS